jgi:hypothetical protein
MRPARFDDSRGELRHPYREPAAVPRRNRPASAVASSPAAHILLGALLAVGLWMGLIARDEFRLRHALAALPLTEQQQMYRRTYEELATVCSTQPRGLEDHCRAEAELILRLPQCDEECQTFARRFFPIGAK